MASASNLDEMKHLYADLIQLETILVQLEVVCENTEYILKCLDNSAEGIERIAVKYTIKGNYSRLINLDELKNNGTLNKDVSLKNEKCRQEIRRLGAEVDNNISYVAKCLEDLALPDGSDRYVSVGIRG